MAHDFQQSVVDMLAPYQDRTKSGRKCNYAIWSYIGLLMVSSWVKLAGNTSPIFLWTLWSPCRNAETVFNGSLYSAKEMFRDLGIYDFNSCALHREVSHHEFFAKKPSLGQHSCSLGQALITI